MVISSLVKVIRENLYIERDRRCLDEYLTYEKKQNGAFGAVTGKHDDLLKTCDVYREIYLSQTDGGAKQ